MKYAHPIARARERYGADMTPEDFDTIKHLVATHQPEAVPLGVTHDGAILVAVRYLPKGSRRRWLATVWRGADILTVLPPMSLMRFGRRLASRERELQAMGRENCKPFNPRAPRLARTIAVESDVAWAVHREGISA